MIFIVPEQKGGNAFFDNLTLAIPILLVGITSIASFFTGILGITKNKDYTILVFLSTIIGFLVLVFLIGEIFFEH